MKLRAAIVMVGITAKRRANKMTMKVNDFLSKAWSKNDCVAIRNVDTSDQAPEYMEVIKARNTYGPEYMEVIKARNTYGDWIVDAFSIHDNILHLWIYSEKNI